MANDPGEEPQDSRLIVGGRSLFISSPFVASNIENLGAQPHSAETADLCGGF